MRLNAIRPTTCLVARPFSTDLGSYFEQQMKLHRRKNVDKPITLGGNLFEKMVKKMETPDDVKIVLNAYCTYLGHRNVLKQTQTDAYLLKALEIG